MKKLALRAIFFIAANIFTRLKYRNVTSRLLDRLLVATERDTFSGVIKND